MRARIGDAVDGVIMREIIGGGAGVAGIESELQDLHAGETGIRDELSDAVRDISQVLRDNLTLSETAFHGAEKVQSGAGTPFPVDCRRFPVGNRVILVKAAKMVNAQNVVEAERGP